MNTVKALVSNTWLRQAIKTPVSKLKVLETSWLEKGKGYEDYLQKHIPSAHFFDLWNCSNPTQYRARDVHNPDCFQEYAQSMGINDDTHVVIYDRGQIFFSARLWYTFKFFGQKHVSVLDGGLANWEQENLPVESAEPPKPQAGNFRVNTDAIESYVRKFEEVSQKGFAEKNQVIDTRHAAWFYGQKPEPADLTAFALTSAGMELPKNPVGGHLPGAKNIEFAKFLDETTKCMVPKEKILEILGEAGIDYKKHVVGICYNGITACFIPLSLSSKLDKHDDVSIYIGSWTEFSQRGTPDMVTKDDSGPASSG